MMKIRIPFLVAGACFSACVSPGLETRLRAIESRQDSILTLLRGMREKNEYMAARMGWRPPAPPPDTSYQEIPVGQSFARGPENASAVVVEFSDLQCPYCAQLTPILDSVANAFPNQVRLVYKHFPLSFHAQARAAAAAAIAAGKQGKFFEFRSRVAPHFRTLGDSLYLAEAEKLGLDLTRFKKDMILTPEIHRMLDEDMALGKKVGVEGTPTVYVNGRMATDRSFEYFAGLIQKAKSVR